MFFLTEALKIKLIPQTDAFDNAKLPRIIQSYNKIRRQKLFQVLLLYENITLLDIPQYNTRFEILVLNSLHDIEYKQSYN